MPDPSLPPPEGPPSEPPGPAPRGGSPFNVFDHRLQIPACRFLVPEGWECGGGIEWRFGGTDQMSIWAGARAPDATAWMEVLNNHLFLWEDSLEPGKRYMETLAAPLPSTHSDYVIGFLLPTFRTGASNVEVIDEGWAPYAWPPPQENIPPGSAGPKGSYVVCDYDDPDGRRIRERFEFTVEAGVQMPIQAGWFRQVVATLWYVYPTISMATVVEELDRLGPAVADVRASLQINPGYLPAVRHHLQQMTRQAEQNTRMIQQQMHASRMNHLRQMNSMQQSTFQTNQETSDIIFDGYMERQGMVDAGHSASIDGIRDVNVWDVGGGPPVEADLQWESVLTDGQGNYVVSDQPYLDPSDVPADLPDVPTSSWWTPMERRD